MREMIGILREHCVAFNQLVLRSDHLEDRDGDSIVRALQHDIADLRRIGMPDASVRIALGGAILAELLSAKNWADSTLPRAQRRDS
jgi:hypothetical protein